MNPEDMIFTNEQLQEMDYKRLLCAEVVLRAKVWRDYQKLQGSKVQHEQVKAMLARGKKQCQ